MELYLVVNYLSVYLEQHCKTDKELAISYLNCYKNDHWI